MCCMLCFQARVYADNSGNPIDTASINALGRNPKEGELSHSVLVLVLKFVLIIKIDLMMEQI